MQNHNLTSSNKTANDKSLSLRAVVMAEYSDFSDYGGFGELWDFLFERGQISTQGLSELMCVNNIQTSRLVVYVRYHLFPSTL